MKKRILVVFGILFLLSSFAFSRSIGRSKVRVIKVTYNNVSTQGNKVLVTIKNRRTKIKKIYVFNKKEFIKKVDWPGRMQNYGFNYSVRILLKRKIRKNNEVRYICLVLNRIGPRRPDPEGGGM
mgnify:CR=1 FL=1